MTGPIKEGSDVKQVEKNFLESLKKKDETKKGTKRSLQETTEKIKEGAGASIASVKQNAKVAKDGSIHGTKAGVRSTGEVLKKSVDPIKATGPEFLKATFEGCKTALPPATDIFIDATVPASLSSVKEPLKKGARAGIVPACDYAKDKAPASVNFVCDKIEKGADSSMKWK